MEKALEVSGLPHTLLYPSWLATNAARDWAGQIRAAGSVALPFPEAQFNPIHPGDVAEVAARLLTDASCRARLQVLTGHPARSFRAWAQEDRDAFAEPGIAAPTPTPAPTPRPAPDPQRAAR